MLLNLWDAHNHDPRRDHTHTMCWHQLSGITKTDLTWFNFSWRCVKSPETLLQTLRVSSLFICSLLSAATRLLKLLLYSNFFKTHFYSLSPFFLSPLLSSVCSPASDTEQDAAVKLDQERAEIVAKYDKVRYELPPASCEHTSSWKWFGEVFTCNCFVFFFTSQRAKFQSVSHAETLPNLITLWWNPAVKSLPYCPWNTIITPCCVQNLLLCIWTFFFYKFTKAVITV